MSEQLQTLANRCEKQVETSVMTLLISAGSAEFSALIIWTLDSPFVLDTTV